jgi:hypothetical protein
MNTEANSRIGSSLDDFLKGEGIYDEVTARAAERVRDRRMKALVDPSDVSDKN